MTQQTLTLPCPSIFLINVNVLAALLSDIRGDGMMQGLYARAQRNYWNQGDQLITHPINTPSQYAPKHTLSTTHLIYFCHSPSLFFSSTNNSNSPACIPLNKQPMSQSLKLTDLAGVILLYVICALGSLVLICVFAPFRERLRYGKSRSGSQPNSVPSNNDEGETKETEGLSREPTVASTIRRAPLSDNSSFDSHSREVREAQARVNGRGRDRVESQEGPSVRGGGGGGDAINNVVLERRLNVVKQQMGVVERQIGTTSKGGTWASLSRGNDTHFHDTSCHLPTLLYVIPTPNHVHPIIDHPLLHIDVMFFWRSLLS